MEEKSVANYIEEGKIIIVENSVFGALHGKTHPSRGFFILKLPFNRKRQILAMNGIYTGVNQQNFPMSVMVHFPRFSLNKAYQQKGLGEAPQQDACSKCQRSNGSFCSSK